MHEDEIISEVWRNRQDYAAEHHQNLHEIVGDLEARQRSPFSRVVDLRTPRSTPKVPSGEASVQGS